MAATHRDLHALIGAGDFRADLFYRIAAFPVRLPPLRERVEDIALLVETFLAGHDIDKRFSEEALAALQEHDFPGNVRELKNLVERALLLADGSTIGPEHLPDGLRARVPTPAARAWEEVVPLQAVVDDYLLWVHQHFAGDARSLARRLGMSERTLYRRLRAARAGT